MSELAVSLLRLSYLLALWLCVFAALGVLRRDTYGTKILRREPGATSLRRGRRRRVAAPPVAPPSHPAADAGSRPSPSTSPAVPAGRQAPTRLVVISGPLRGTTLPLGHGLTIGRSATSNLVLDDEFTSGRHALITPRDGVWYVEDLGSTNGTFVGRQRLRAPVAVQAGSAIRIGQTRVELR
ncbi:MAG: FHA domain-containing protein [Bifidobacteriaceae bacterium]|jgi:pSer/pThr/pTyr-binding forkhead associated (FHA) protein|nr:FHA domain-containing protein [Bifidobacteriaceae bacterium]